MGDCQKKAFTMIVETFRSQIFRPVRSWCSSAAIITKNLPKKAKSIRW